MPSSAQTINRLASVDRFLERLIEALPAAIYTTDAAGRITFFNKAAAELGVAIPS